MAIPHIIQMQLIRERLRDKDGKARLKEIEDIKRGLPRYNNGPYGEIWKWLDEEIEKTRTRSNVKHQDWLGVKRQGMRQFVLVGAPNVGKSSLLNKLSHIQIKMADYEFTTLKPQPGIVDINGAQFQLVDLPGLIQGAVDNIGGGKRLLGIVKNSDGIILMHDLTKPLESVESILGEIEKAKIEKPLIVIGSKIDNSRIRIAELRARFPNVPVIGLSNKTGEGIEELKQTLWRTSGIMRVHSKGESTPMILEKGATLRDFCEHIHKGLSASFKYAKVTGTSARFPNQQLGIYHVLEDEDRVEVLFKK